MNGRVYDYNLGRFLSVDPFIQSPGNSQSVNPYSYIMNNPLAGTDPTGYCAAATGTRIKSCGDLKVDVTVTMKDGSTATQSTVVKNVNFKNGADVSSAMSKGAAQAGGQFSMSDFGGQSQVAKTDPAKQSSGGQQSSPSGGTSTDEYITPEGVHDFGTAEVDGHAYNVTATFGQPDSDSGGNPYSLPENMVTVAGLAAGVAEHGKHPYWLAANGKIYPSRWGGNQHTGGKNKAIAQAKGMAAKLGKGLFFTYAGVRAVDAIDKITTMRASGDMDGIRSEAIDAGLDVAIGAIGVWGGPVGWGIAGAYWIADEFVFDGNLAKGVSQWFRREEEYSQ